MKALTAILCFVLGSYMQAQNAAITGTVKDATSKQALADVRINIEGTEQVATSDGEGVFTFENVLAGRQVLFFSLEQYAILKVDVSVKGQETVVLGDVMLSVNQSTDLISAEDFIPTISLSDTDDQSVGSQDISGILSASRDVFVSTAAFTFGPARFRIRGYDADQTSMYLNGVPVNSLENGWVSWSSWSGLNDVLRSREISIGLAPMSYTFGGAGGGSNIDTRASSQWKQTRVSYAISNRSYRNRVMVTHATGMMDNGWAIAISASRRWANQGYVAGTFYDATSYFLSIDRKLGKKQLLNITAFGAPNKRGKSGASVQEMYDIAGTNYYNSYWGYQNGEKRNSRVSNRHEPMIILRHDWKISDQSSLTTSANYQFGRNGSTALDWYNARDPRPDYYRLLPSYINTAENSTESSAAVAEQVREYLSENEDARQVDWQNMYDVNRSSVSFESIENANGIEGNTVSGQRSKYIVEDRRYDSKKMNFNTVFETVLSQNMKLNAGVTYQYYKGQNFKVVDDLLGGDFYVDINNFAERDFPDNEDIIQNDLNNPNRILEVGDKFGYNYDSNIRQSTAWLQTDFNFNKIDFFVAANVSNMNYWRTGNTQTGLFPDSSFGDSEKYSFMNYGVKGGATYKINGRNYLYANAAYLTRPPLFRNAFVSPRTRDQIAPNLSNEIIQTNEAGYVLRSPYLKARASVYYTTFQNQTKTNSFYHDVERSFVNFTLTGIDKRHAGTELAIESKVFSGLTVNAVAAVGQYTYNSRPSAFISQDNNAEILEENQTIYAKNFYVAGTPQSAFSGGLSYRSSKFWFANLNFNYFTNSWLDFNPSRRTAAAVDLVDYDSDLWNNIIDQELNPSAFTVDFFGGKSWRINRKYFINLNVGVSNILNNKNFITGGYEQLRFDFEGKDTSKFPPRYYYSYGTNYFMSVTFRM